MRLLTIAVLTLGAALTAYGLFALTFAEEGGPTSVTLFGRRLDAHRIGATTVITGTAVVIGVLVSVRRRRVAR
jgi:hypothetical protein